MNEVSQYKDFIDTYKHYYFSVYKYLINKEWKIFEEDFNSNNQLWFEWLTSPSLSYKYNKDLIDSIYILDVDDADKFDVDIFKCKTIIPPNDFISSLNLECLSEKKVIEDFNNYRSNVDKQIDKLFVEARWIYTVLEDIESYWGTEDTCNNNDVLEVYISPLAKRLNINKTNIYSLLNDNPNLIINKSIWWNYD